MKQSLRFILIDDDPGSNKLSQLSIQKNFDAAEIILFTAPEEGITYIENTYSDEPCQTILLLDINMPGLSGWDVLEIFMRYPDSIKQHFTIYMLSSSICPQDKQIADAYDIVSGYIEKPLTKSRIQALFMGETFNDHTQAA